MATKTIAWESGGGNITVDYDGSGDGQIVVTSSDNATHSDRSQTITVKTLDGGITRTVTVVQQAKPYISLDTAVVTAPAQTYSGSALMPTPTVTLGGVVVASDNYDVTWLDNTNAGTGTVAVTGKGDYTGTATGTFTIAKATPTITAYPTNANPTYNGSAQYLLTGGTSNVSGSFSYSTGTNAGSYTATWTFTPTDTTNYNSVSGTVAATIAKANRTVSFSNPTTSVTVGDTVTNTATVSAGASDGTLAYSSSNTSYATVNSSGVVTAVASGNVTITASITGGTNYNDASGSYSMSVKVPLANGAYIEYNDGTLLTASEWNPSVHSVSYVNSIVVVSGNQKRRLNQSFNSSQTLSSSRRVSGLSSCTDTVYGDSNTDKMYAKGLTVQRRDFPYLGSSAYLPAQSEISYITGKLSQINVCCQTIGWTQFPSSSTVFWTSTYHSDDGSDTYFYASNNKGGKIRGNSFAKIYVGRYE